MELVLARSQEPLEVRLASSKWKSLGSILLAGTTLFVLYKAVSAQRGGGGLMDMMRGTHSMAADVSERFDDVIGLTEAKQEVMVLVDYLRDPGKYVEFGVKMPKVRCFVSLLSS